MSLLSKDVVVLPESTVAFPDRWVLMNVFARTSLGVTGKVIEALGRGALALVPAEETFTCWDVERFSNEDGMMADPSRYQREIAKWKGLTLGRDALLAKLREKFLIVDDEAAYRARFADKKNVLDRNRFGNFHQQHGQHMLLARRADPAKWWMEQKFTPDYLHVRPETLYGAVQWEFLKGYFAARIRPGMHVVDLGCGTGIYANAMAQHGASVLGVDPSADYLAIARTHALPGARFEQLNAGAAGALDTIPSASADIVFMSDALLFYYRQFYPGQEANIEIILGDIRRILKPDGVFVSLEPHGSFYLNPWLGAEDRPFTVVTEYLNKWYGIVPPLSWLASRIAAAGLLISDLQEITPAPYLAEADLRAYAFATEFPLWQLLEIKKAP